MIKVNVGAEVRLSVNDATGNDVSNQTHDVQGSEKHLLGSAFQAFRQAVERRLALLVPAAELHYEQFHNLPTGTCPKEKLKASSAGIRGLAETHLSSETTSKAQGNDAGDGLLDVEGFENKLLESAFHGFLQAQSLQSLGTTAEYVLAQAAARFNRAYTLHQMAVAYMRLRDDVAHYSLENVSAVKQGMRYARDMLTWQFCLENEVINRTRFLNALGETLGPTWDGQLVSQLLLSFYKCCVYAQSKTNTKLYANSPCILKRPRRAKATKAEPSEMRIVV